MRVPYIYSICHHNCDYRDRRATLIQHLDIIKPHGNSLYYFVGHFYKPKLSYIHEFFISPFVDLLIDSSLPTEEFYHSDAAQG